VIISTAPLQSFHDVAKFVPVYSDAWSKRLGIHGLQVQCEHGPYNEEHGIKLHAQVDKEMLVDVLYIACQKFHPLVYEQPIQQMTTRITS
jgi:hypothetical protein